nr:MAG TPA: DNA adenine methylase [Caudoviricetes sp.]
MKTLYGVPYQGSKNSIAEKIINIIPSAENFYDLLAGGCAITHCAMLANRWKNFYVNDIDNAPLLFKKAIAGEFKDEKRWISRDDFYNLKDIDVYVSICWSFGNNRQAYLYAREIEPWKKALHYARVFKDFSLLNAMGIQSDGTAKDIIKNQKEYKNKYIAWYVKNVQKNEIEYEHLRQNLTENINKNKEDLRLYLCNALKKSGLKQSDVNKRLNTQMSGHYFGRSQWAFPTREEYDKMREFMPLEKDYDEIYGVQDLLESLQSLGRLESLQRLESLERLTYTQTSYENVQIKPNSVIYCDIPYEDTKGYISGEFNHKAFYDWACEQSEPVYISSYNISDNRFEEIWSWQKVSLYSSTSNFTVTERIYGPKHQKKLYPATLFDF